MTKEEFLKQLDEKLKENGVENTEEVLDIYRKRFDIYYEIDYKDEEIIEALWTPESIALRYKPHEEKQEEPEIIHPEEQKIEKDETSKFISDFSGIAHRFSDKLQWHGKLWQQCICR